MTTTTPSRVPKPRHPRHHRSGLTLVEVMVGASLASFVLAGVVSTFLFLGRSGANISNYSEMETEARGGLELFAQDTRQASDLYWNSASSVRLSVGGSSITYAYNSGDQTFTRTTGSGSTVLVSGVSEFSFTGYMITGTSVALNDLSTAAKRDAASDVTKQLQVYLKASRSSVTVTTATNTVLSARYILRNKRVTT
ncbi:PilW family protein [Actomonas aquatica]|uniref:Prepilin-type N-terminal cleavage/methylation domain-containing protein n=1 Tax=Actomonas aquatica TaxID=2866162 RepID=A0ABZ1C4X9_9BACT|nr:prepilin-type N-terminal cleavage/methylation domain-containing protein [Opitutus sp. WL0086]WRQ86787.1 prepilin-type N-terminal cleavage/methylation domain-containing protein [Opitutus sp. WL0086]